MKNDLIERQAAIDALKKYEELESNNFTDTSPISMMTVATIANCIEEIVNLPSAEPERIIKIGQRSGKTLESAIDYLHSVGWLQEHDRILTESAEPERKWIPVTEALPEEEKDVLVSVHFEGFKGKTVDLPPSDYVEIASHVDGVWSSLSDEYKAIEVNHHVVAWAKLPEPWKGEK